MIEKLKSALFVLLLMGAFTACSDDDTPAPAPVVPDVEVEEPESNEPTAEELAEMAAADKFFAANSVIRALAMVSELPDNWESTTFEPQAGVVIDEANSDVRNMISSSAADAKNYFLSIVPDLGLNGNTWSHEGVGSLTFRALNEADCYAVIDVNLVQMPGLKQLRFVPKEVMGDNAFDGTPYYFAGDIVEDKNGVYWICVRPAGGPEGKGYAYFVTCNSTVIGKSTKEIDQKIYEMDNKGKLNKNVKYACSGKWVYAKNLVEERIALAAAHTFAMMKLDNDKYQAGQLNFAEKSKELALLYGFDVNAFDNAQGVDEMFSCNIAYGDYVSNKYTKVRQEKYLQPFMRVSVYDQTGYDMSTWFSQLVEKVSLDPNQKKTSSPYLLSLTADYNPSAFQLLYGSKGANIVGLTDRTFNIGNYYWKSVPGETMAQYTNTRYMTDYLNEKVLVLAQTCVKDHGKPYKDFKLLNKDRPERESLFWKTLGATVRVLYDVNDSGILIDDITN